jgi:hypothetical protein
MKMFKFVQTHKTFFLSIGFLVVFAVTVSYATPPTQPFNPGQTLDPSCAPGETNCTVTVSPWTISGSAVYYNTGNVGIGTATPSSALQVAGQVTADNLFITGTGASTVLGSPSNLQAAFSYNDPDSVLTASGYGFNYKVYAYKIVGSSRVYSSGYATLSSVLLDDNSGTPFTINMSWGAVPGADGYRILKFINNAGVTLSGFDYGHYSDVTTNSFNDPVGGALPGNTVTPTVPTTYTNNSVINGNTVAGGSFTVNGLTALNGNISLGGGSLFDVGSNSLGIGTTTPIAALDLEGDGAIIARGSLVSGAPVPDLGSGVRMMWIPSAAAFRAGYANSDLWDSANVGQGSAAFGVFTMASGGDSAAFGFETRASGELSAAFGYQTVASGQGSAAFGDNTIAGNYSAAFGFQNVAGDNSGIFGASNTDTGSYNILAGLRNTSSAFYTGTFGYSNNNTSFDSFVVGSYSVGGGDPLNWIATDPLFEVGNGDPGPGVRSNALTVLKNGNVGIKVAAPSYLLQVGDNTLPAGAVARFQSSSGICDINPTTSALVCSSDMNLKQNISNLGDNSSWNFNTNITADNQTVLAKILALNPVSYNWRTEAEGSAKHPGFIAQEVQQIFPDLVATDPTSGLLSLNYTGLIPYTVEAIKEMNIKIDALQAFAPQTLGQNVSDAFAYIKNLAVGNLRVGTSDKPTGITLYDKATGNPYCLSITNGQSQTTAGECTTAPSGNTGSSGSTTGGTSDSTNTSTDTSETTGTQTPEVSDPVVSTPADGATQSPSVAPVEAPATPAQ